MSMYYPSLKKFTELSRKGNVVPVYRQLFADTLTPLSAFQKISVADYAFLLESADGGEKIARYSFLGSDPFLRFKCQGFNVESWRSGEVLRYKSHDPFSDLEKHLNRYSPVRIEGLPNFFGGAVGYVSYDSVRYVEDLPNSACDDFKLPDIYFMFYDIVVIFDHLHKTIKVVCAAYVEGKSIKEVYGESIGRVDALVEKLRTPVMELSSDIPEERKTNLEYSSNFKKSDFLNAVGTCKEYIKAGDIIQVVISQRLKAETTAKPINIYRTLRVINPSPYMFYMKIGEIELIGSSPEVMVKVEEGRVNVRPIAGTRWRGQTAEEDELLAKELLSDPKERAEHIMLLDLGRNDVGRVSEHGSVVIDNRMIIEKFSHVMHITSSVSGSLRKDKNAFDCLKACLPAGTLSGAPKIRAMEIIDDLEPTRRGPYGGAVGYIDFYGNINTCITIRTIVLKNGTDAYIQAGAGIVSDSIPEREYQETLNKAKGLLKAIQVAESMEVGK
ncbi:MAG: anthranilate synthase component I [Candidatus Scalindua sp. AMX11]|nr:MAG: anthranilate synthase component I [Candidatus Scalindua sp.]NOG84816.1 anthranilate synthase component I [Planctomycetota bacterium]RZV98416.1 MAG: anthranilate synthase component I [Candidatus Scalindua sp. SCAELEC01]TDE66617.1 MAG: anthranilate synthase component I [Candidatus Scalindua sp. AMX11]